MLLFLLFVSLGLAYPTQIKYTLGVELDYNLTSHIDAQGHLVQGGTTPGSTSILTSIVAVKAIEQYTNDSWLLVMDMYNTEVGVGQGESGVIEKSKLSSDESGAEPLGDYMYFEQKFDGTIPNIWYEEGDSPILVQIKVSAINAFQTKLVKPLQTVDNVKFKDPGGDYTATVVGGKDDTIFAITKDFDQSFFKEFSDPDVTAQNLDMTGSTVTNVHTEGYVHGANLGQTVVMVNMQKFASSSRRDVDPNAGFDMNLGSIGTLDLNILTGNDAPETGLLGEVTAMPEGLVQSTLFDCARDHIHAAKLAFEADDILTRIGSLMDSLFQEGTEDEMNYLKLHKLIDLFNHPAADGLVMMKFVPVLSQVEKLSRKQSDALFFVLSQLNDHAVPALFVNYGFMSKNPVIRIQSMLSSQSVENPTSYMIDALLDVYRDETVDAEVRVSSIMSYGSCIDKLDRKERSEEKKKYLMTFHYLIRQNSDSDPLSTSLLYAYLNTNEPLPQSISVLFKDSDDLVIHEIMKVYNSYDYGEDYKTKSNDDDFPFFKEVYQNYTVGGSAISFTVSGELFAGTNFDCNEEYFNFKLLAQVLGDGKFLGIDESVFNGHVIYGQAEGSRLADEIYLSLFNKVLYQKSIPSIDCVSHTYPLAHSSPGTSLSYTLWISIIPVTFTLSVDATLDLSWGWEVCLTKLYCEAELIPGASVVVSAGANINLLIVRAGVEVQGTLGPVNVIPRAYIDGSQCEIGFDVTLKMPDPIHVQLDAYYQFKKCKFLIFDCKWDKEHEKIFWQWNSNPLDKVLFQEVYKIEK